MADGWSKPVLRTLADQVAETILREIASGNIAEGEALPPQRELARTLGVGMSVVREAVQRLQSLKILRAHHGRGTIVQNLNWNQLLFQSSLRLPAIEIGVLTQVWEARYAIEKETTRLAAERADEADLAAMHDVLERATPYPPDIEANRVLNTEFHMAIARAAKNIVLADMLQPLLELPTEIMREIFDAEISARSWEVHKAMYRGIAAHDVAATKAALDRHIAASDVEMARARALSPDEPILIPLAS